MTAIRPDRSADAEDERVYDVYTPTQPHFVAAVEKPGCRRRRGRNCIDQQWNARSLCECPQGIPEQFGPLGEQLESVGRRVAPISRRETIEVKKHQEGVAIFLGVHQLGDGLTEVSLRDIRPPALGCTRGAQLICQRLRGGETCEPKPNSRQTLQVGGKVLAGMPQDTGHTVGVGERQANGLVGPAEFTSRRIMASRLSPSIPPSWASPSSIAAMSCRSWAPPSARLMRCRTFRCAGSWRSMSAVRPCPATSNDLDSHRGHATRARCSDDSIVATFAGATAPQSID